MGRHGCRLKIFAIDEEEKRRERALLLVDALAATRAIEGNGPWIATYPAADASEAFASCAEDLSAIDPRWVEVLDFVALPARAGPSPILRGPSRRAS
jgi:hypothetical protein